MKFKASVSCEDAISKLKSMRKNSLGGIVTCPPDGRLKRQGVWWDSRPFSVSEFLEESYKVVKDDSAVVLICGLDLFATFCLAAPEYGWKTLDEVIEKGRPSNHWQTSIRPLKVHEYVLVLYKSILPFYETTVVKDNGKIEHQKTVTKFNAERMIPKKSEFYHRAATPLPIVQHYMKSHIKPGSTILDPFCGSGTTAEACFNLGINFIGCDILPKYHKMTEKRIQYLREGISTI
jgi:DNA modification methylase